jgi:hypothetical protein
VSTISKNAARTVGEDLEKQSPIWIVPFVILGPKGVQLHEIGILVRSTGSLTFREKYSFLTLHPMRLLV